MKRVVCVLLLGCVGLLAGWAVAQPPSDGQEPPVRLQKKKKAAPEKTEPGTQTQPKSGSATHVP